MSDYLSIAPDVKLGEGVKLSRFINLYGCEVGDNTKIGAFVEIQKNARIGRNCKISSHTFICEGVTIEDNVFIGHGVTFINDSYPRATTPRRGAADREGLDGRADTGARRALRSAPGRRSSPTSRSARMRSIGAGSVVTRDVPANAIVAGTPARADATSRHRQHRGPTMSDA